MVHVIFLLLIPRTHTLPLKVSMQSVFEEVGNPCQPTFHFSEEQNNAK